MSEKSWLRSFFAVDNEVNEQTVAGVYFGLLALAVFIVRMAGVETVTAEMLYIPTAASLACFGISGFKK